MKYAQNLQNSKKRNVFKNLSNYNNNIIAPKGRKNFNLAYVLLLPTLLVAQNYVNMQDSRFYIGGGAL